MGHNLHQMNLRNSQVTRISSMSPAAPITVKAMVLQNLPSKRPKDSFGSVEKLARVYSWVYLNSEIRPPKMLAEAQHKDFLIVGQRHFCQLPKMHWDLNLQRLTLKNSNLTRKDKRFIMTKVQNYCLNLKRVMLCGSNPSSWDKKVGKRVPFLGS